MAGVVQGGIRHPSAPQPWGARRRAELGFTSPQPSTIPLWYWNLPKVAQPKHYHIAVGQGELSSTSHLPSQTQPHGQWYPHNPPDITPEPLAVSPFAVRAAISGPSPTCISQRNGLNTMGVLSQAGKAAALQPP